MASVANKVRGTGTDEIFRSENKTRQGSVLPGIATWGTDGHRGVCSRYTVYTAGNVIIGGPDLGTVTGLSEARVLPDVRDRASPPLMKIKS